MRNKLIWPALALVVFLLIGVNLAMREDAEPDLGHAPAPPPRSGESTIVVPNPEDLEGRVPVQEAEPDEAPAEPEGEPVEGAVCDHPFVPSTAGQWRRYRWTQSDQERAAELRIRAGAARQVDDEVQVRWRARVVATDDETQLAEAPLTTRCVPGDAAEEPWFGILERALGLRLTARAGRWRWPARLEEGQRFRGTATFDPRAADMRPPEGVTEPGYLRVTRRHVVGPREQVEVPAGTFSAWRVDYEETQEFRGHGETGTGTLWVAESVGLVKSEATNSEGVSQTLALMALGGPE